MVQRRGTLRRVGRALGFWSKGVLPAALVFGIFVACGAAAGEGGGDTDLPTRGAGPFGKLPPNPDTPLAEPVVLADPSGLEDWRSPALIVEGGGRYTVYFAAALEGRVEIRRASGLTLTHGSDDISGVLEPEATWEASRVDHPGVVVPGVDHGLGLFYEGGEGAIGYAGSDDGVTFERHPANPVLWGDGFEEGDRVGEPSALWHRGDLWLYYASFSRGAIFVARFPRGDLTSPERLDGDDRTPEREPVLGPNPFAEQFDVGGVSAPHVRVTAPAGRPVFDLWYAGHDGSGRPTVGFAGSFDGLLWKRLEKNPVLPAGGVVETDPCVVSLGVGALMVFTQVPSSGRLVIAAAVH